MIKLQGVSKYYGDVAAIKDVTLNIPKGEFTFLVGSFRGRQIYYNEASL